MLILLLARTSQLYSDDRLSPDSRISSVIDSVCLSVWVCPRFFFAQIDCRLLAGCRALQPERCWGEDDEPADQGQVTLDVMQGSSDNCVLEDLGGLRQVEMRLTPVERRASSCSRLCLPTAPWSSNSGCRCQRRRREGRQKISVLDAARTGSHQSQRNK